MAIIYHDEVTMSDTTFPSYNQLASELQAASLAINPAELHGLIAGMLAGGLTLNDQSWQPLLFDYTNDGMGWPTSALEKAKQLLLATQAELASDDFKLTLLVPITDDTNALFQFADGVADWVNHFISGLGLMAVTMSGLSSHAKEALQDLEEIAKLGVDEEDDLDQQAQLLEHVIEHIKACVFMLYIEFKGTVNPDTKPIVH